MQPTKQLGKYQFKPVAKNIKLNTKKVSIILPFKNARSTLEECVQSIINQSLKDWELIAINDRSSDGSLELVKQFAKTDNRIQIYNNKGKGIVDALNYGLTLSTADFIARMDADDRMKTERLRLQIEYLQEMQDVGLVSSKVVHIPEEGYDARGFSSYIDWMNEIKSSNEISINRFIESPLAHPSVMFRKELISKYGNYHNGDFPEDYELWLRLLDNGVKIEKVDACLLEWRDTPRRLSRNDSRYKLESFQMLKAKFVSRWISKEVPKNLSIHGWGAGDVAKQQLKHLEEYGVSLECIYDIDFKKTHDPKLQGYVLHVEEIPEPGEIFLIVLIGAHGVRKKIVSFLSKRGYCAGKNYLLMA